MKNLRVFWILLLSSMVKPSNAQWLPVSTGATDDIYGVQYLDTNTIFLAGVEGLIKSNDAGLNWTTLPLLDGSGNPIIASFIKDVYFFDATTGVATGTISSANSEVILRTTNGGNNWSYVSINNTGTWPRMLNDIDFYSITTGFAVGTNGRILRTTNGGSSWSPRTSGTSNELRAIDFGSTSNGLAVGNQVICRTLNGGTTWTATSYPLYNLHGVYMISATEAYAVGDNMVLHTTNTGSSWTVINTSSGKDIYGIDQDTLFTCGTAVLKTINSGAFWGGQDLPPNTYHDIDFTNANKGYIVGNDGAVFKTYTCGESFPDNDAGVSQVITPATFCPSNLPISVKITNYGIVPLTSATINWTLDGVLQTPYSWTGSLAPTIQSAPIFMDSVFLNLGPHMVQAWTSLPNAVTDEFMENDSTETGFSSQKMGGAYTVGGTSPDFATLTNAFAALNLNGICDSIILNLRNGTYNANLSLPVLADASALRTITIQSETGDSSAVILTSSSGISLSFNGANYFRIKKLTVTASNNYAVEFKNGSNNNKIENCVLQGVVSATTTNHSTLGYAGTPSSNNQINFTTIRNGYYGVYLKGNPTVYADNIQIAHCFFDNQAQQGINLQYLDHFNVFNNKIEKLGSPVTYQGIQAKNCRNAFNISGNRIAFLEGTGIYLEQCTDLIGNESLVSNNFIKGGNAVSSSAKGLCVIDCNNEKIYHNSISIQGGSNVVSLQVDYPDTLSYTNLHLLNNIFNADGISVDILPSTFSRQKIFAEIGHNAYFSRSDFPWSLGPSDLATFDQWRNLIVFDSTSQFTDPQFMPGTNLHIYPQTHNYQLKNAGVFVSESASDIDGTLRDAAPDIGAAEFDIVTHDIAPVVIIGEASVCLGTQPVNVQVRNFGSLTITSLHVNWKVDGIIQTPYVWSGTLTQNDTTSLFSIGSYNFVSGTHLVEVWTSDPNAGADLNMGNDTLETDLNAGGMSGTYTIGGTMPNYATVSAAVSALNTNGVCGPVFFDIRPGTYTEQVIVPVITGTSAGHQITFRSETGDSTSVVIRYSSSLTLQDFVLKLNGADFIVFEKLTFRTVSSTETKLIILENNASNNSIKHCRFEEGKIGICSTGDFLDEYNTIENNVFAGPPSLATYPIAVYFEGNSIGTDVYEKGNKLLDNLVIGIYSGGFEMHNQESLKITTNVFQDSVGSTVFNTTSIWVDNSLNNLEIGNNKIYGKIESGIKSTDHHGGYYTPARLFNNLVSLWGDEVNCAINLSGIPGETYAEVIHNSCNLSNPTAVLFSYCIKGSAKSLKLYNNIFCNKAGGTTADLALVGLQADHNLYFTNGTELIQSGSFSYDNLVNWKNDYSQDIHSYQGDPLFVSETNLHRTALSYAEGGGSLIWAATVPTDIDQEPRNPLHPDIGADEANVSLAAHDAGIVLVIDEGSFCSGTVPVKVVFKNFSPTTMNSVQLNWSVNNIVQTPFSWSGSVTSLTDSDTITIGSYAFTAADTFDVKAWTTLPDGFADATNYNDTSALTEIQTQLGGTLTIGPAPSDFSTLASASAALNSLGVCAPVILMIKPGVYVEDIINLGAVPGVDSVNTITFRSQTGNFNDVILQANIPVTIANTNYITFSDLTFYDADLFNAIQTNTSDHIRFVNNWFRGTRIFSPGDYLLFDNNTFEKGSINTVGTMSIHLNDITIQNNHMVAMEEGIRLKYVDRAVIEGNYLQCGVTESMFDGIAVENSTEVTIQKNQVYGEYYRGFYVTASGTVGDESLICNNVASGQYYSNAVLGVPNTKVMYNSFFQPNDTLSGCVWLTSSTNVTFVNNTLSGGMYALTISTPGTLVSDYNNIYTTTPTPVKYNSINYTSVNAYQLASGKDIHSISVDPLYISATDLHFQDSTLTDAAIPVSEVTDDIQGKPRDVVSPNIGAYELSGDTIVDSLNRDLVLYEFITDTLLLGTNMIGIRVLLTSPFASTPYYQYTGTEDSLYLSYRVNGGSAVTELWTGTLNMYDTLEYTFTTPYFVPKGRVYHFTAKLSTPEDTLDVNHFNDSLQLQFLMPMQGIYTIGGTSPDFVTLEQSKTEYDLCEGGPVTFKIRSGTYPETSWSAPSWATYTPSTAPLCIYASETGNPEDVNLTIKHIYEKGNIKFKNLTITTKRSDSFGLYDYVYGMNIDQSWFVDFDSCIFQGAPNPDQRTGISIQGCRAINITNCKFRDLDYGINFSEYSFFIATLLENFRVENCIFDTVGTPIRFASSLGTDTLFIRNNIMNRPSIGMSFVPEALEHVLVEANQIISADSIGIYAYGPFIGAGAYLTFMNNMISSEGKRAFRIEGTEDAQFYLYNNSLYGSLYLENAYRAVMYNNSVYSATLFPALEISNLYHTYSFGEIIADNNNYYAPLATTPIYVLYNSLLEAYSLSELESNLHVDSSSISIDPGYTSNTDLHIYLSNALDSKGKPVPGLTTDIDLDPRDVLTPDIGADEYISYPFLVWPGDTDNDSIVTNLDLLPIGLHYGLAGFARATISNSWTGYACSDWGVLQINGWDTKYVDANGDGTIDAADTIAVVNNNGLTRNMVIPSWLPLTMTGEPDIYFIPSEPLYMGGDTVEIGVYVGNISEPVNDLYGIAYTSLFDASLIVPGTLSYTQNNSWIAPVGNRLYIQKPLETEGAIQAAFTRISHIDTTGYGLLGTIRFILRTDYTTTQTVNLGFGQVYAVDDNGEEITLDPIPASFVAEPYVSDVTEINSLTGLSIYPNPFSDQLSMDLYLAQNAAISVVLYNQLGERLGELVRGEYRAGKNSLQFNPETLLPAAGIYFVQVKVNETNYTGKLIYAPK